MAKGRFLAYAGPTEKNIYFIDDDTGKVKNGTHAIFDEAHMSAPQQHAPIAAQALQRLGYAQDEEYQQYHNQPIRVQYMNEQVHNMNETIHGYNIYPDVDSMEIQPHETTIVQTGILIHVPNGIIAELQNLPTTCNTTHQISPAVLQTSNTNEIFVLLKNITNTSITITRDRPIAVLSFSKQDKIPVIEEQLETTLSSNIKLKIQPRPIPRLSIDTIPIATNARAAKLEKDLHVALDVPYELHLTHDPFEYYCNRTIEVKGKSPTLGIKLTKCPSRNSIVI